MTLREFYLLRREIEFPTFMKVLRALPAKRLSYKPHKNSPSAEQLVWTLTSELKVCLDVALDGRAEWKLSAAPPPLPEMLEKFETWSHELMAAVAAMDEGAWDRKAEFLVEGQVVFEQPAGNFLWFMMFDAIHHRGQLSAYLRPMGGKVPAIYGPSGDEPQAAAGN